LPSEVFYSISVGCSPPLRCHPFWLEQGHCFFLHLDNVNTLVSLPCLLAGSDGQTSPQTPWVVAARRLTKRGDVLTTSKFLRIAQYLGRRVGHGNLRSQSLKCGAGLCSNLFFCCSLVGKLLVVGLGRSWASCRAAGGLVRTDLPSYTIVV